MPLDPSMSFGSMTADAAILPHAVTSGEALTSGDALSLPVPVPSVQTGLAQTDPEPQKTAQAVLDLPARCGLEEVQERIWEDDRGKWDQTIPRERLSLCGGEIILPAEYHEDYPTCLALSPWATAQACQRLGIPPDYFRRLSRPLKDANFNHWLWRQKLEPDEDGASPGSPRPWLLRCKNQTVRAVLSDRYVPLDNADLLAILVPLLEGRFEVRSLSLTPESLHLRLVDPRLAREVLPDDRLMAGVHFKNSETGNHSVSVDAMVWRLICLNGMVKLVRGKSLLRQRHVSWDHPRFADALRRAVSEALTAGAGLIDRLEAATREPVPDVEGVIRALGQQAALTQSVQERVRLALLATPPSQAETVYGLTQALTLVAQSLAPDDRYALEVTAGRLLDEGLPAPVKLIPVQADAVIYRSGNQRARGNGRMSGG